MNKCQYTSLFYHHRKTPISSCSAHWPYLIWPPSYLALSRIDASIGESIGESINSLFRSLYCSWRKKKEKKTEEKERKTNLTPALNCIQAPKAFPKLFVHFRPLPTIPPVSTKSVQLHEQIWRIFSLTQAHVWCFDSSEQPSENWFDSEVLICSVTWKEGIRLPPTTQLISISNLLHRRL